eukprot:scaffold302604_cov25-Prasinocladus_malaysianus.AAC.1
MATARYVSCPGLHRGPIPGKCVPRDLIRRRGDRLVRVRGVPPSASAFIASHHLAPSASPPSVHHIYRLGKLWRAKSHSSILCIHTVSMLGTKAFEH